METKKFNLEMLILGILSVWISLTAFRNPMESLASIVIIVSITLIVKGLVILFASYEKNNIFGMSKVRTLVLSALYLVMGFGLGLHIWQGILVLPYVFAIWFIVTSVMYLIGAKYYSKQSKPLYFFYIVVNILGIFVGVSLLLNPLSSVLTINFLFGFYFFVLGIEEIVLAF